MLYHVLVTENGTEKIIIVDSYSQPTPANPIDASVSQHLVATDNPHQTSLQQAIAKQGVTPVNGEVRIGTTNYNDEMLTILKSTIYMVLNGDLRSSSFDVNGFYHTTRDGLNLFMDNAGVRLYNGVNTITIGYDGTITGLQDSQLAHSAVTKAYVDSLALGLMPHAPVKVMLEKGTDLYTFNSHGSGVGKTLTAVQNGVFNYQAVLFAVGDRIGLNCYGYQRLDAGIYVITQLGDANNPWVLTRAADFDGSQSNETKQADVLFVQEGRYAKYMFIETQKGSEPNSGNLIIDTDLVTWEVFHKPQDFIFDQGLQLNGQTVSVKPDITTGDTVIPVSVSSFGVGVQRSIITDIAEAKKQEAIANTTTQIQVAKTYTDQSKADAISQSKTYSDGLKTASDQALQTVLQQTITNDNAVIVACNNNAATLSQANQTYTDQKVAALATTIPTSTSSKPMLYPQFFLLNGQTIQNYSDYLFIDNAYRSGNDGGLNSNNCIPFMMPENGTLMALSIYIGAVAVGGNYVANSILNVNFELRQIVVGGTNTIATLSIPMNGASGQIGSYGNFPATPVAVNGSSININVALNKCWMYGIKFINNTTGSPVIASAIKNVVIKLEIRVG